MTSDESVVSTESTPAKIRHRLLAMVYDGLIILLLTTVTVMIIQAVLIGGNEIPPDHILNKILKPFWFVPGYFYLTYYWRKNGQTPSMKVWNIQLQNHNGHLISVTQSLLRYISALLGLGLILALFNKNRASLQDIISQTRVVKTK